jgi:hypothetical protein
MNMCTFIDKIQIHRKHRYGYIWQTINITNITLILIKYMLKPIIFICIYYLHYGTSLYDYQLYSSIRL